MCLQADLLNILWVTVGVQATFSEVAVESEELQGQLGVVAADKVV